MARVKRGATAHQRKKKILKRAKGYYSGRSKLLKTAREAVEKAGDLADAHYQLGLVLANASEWAAAAAEFDRVAEINPSLAYAYYYGGLMHYRANRPDRMANRFEQFLKLAPNAPERPEVVQIMRTVRGR